MKMKLSTTLAIAFAFLLMGHAAQVFASEKSVLRKHVIIGMIAGKGATRALDPTVSSGAKAIWIYLGAQEAFLTENGIVVKTYRISSGAADTPTPLGVFQVYDKEELRVSSQETPYRMPNYMAFTENDAFGLHGLPYLGRSAESSGYWNEALSHIGTPVSHGCVRFLPEEAAEIYQWADVGIPVIIQD